MENTIRRLRYVHIILYTLYTHPIQTLDNPIQLLPSVSAFHLEPIGARSSALEELADTQYFFG